MANPSDSLHRLLIDRLQKNSGFDERRPYIGMSKASECPRVLYFEYFDGTPATIDNHIGAWLGYTIEAAVLKLLGDDVKPGIELSAFNGMVKGHTDGEWRGDMLEIKSTTNKHLREHPDISRRHFDQVQAYMHWGPWRQAHIIYVPRDFGCPIVKTVSRDDRVGAKIEERFAGILNAIYDEFAPRCECGRCRS